MSISYSKKSNLENIDLIQIEYLLDLPVTIKDIIVIEPSNSITLTLRKFLIELGFENIHACKNSEQGIQIFLDFIKNEINVPIILDDSCSGTDSERVVKEILENYANANIVIITAKEKNNPSMEKLFDMGVVSMTCKPLNFDDLKKSLLPIFGRNNDNRKAAIEKTFETLLSTTNKISQNQIRDLLKIENSEIAEMIRNAEEKHKIVLDKEVLEPTCNQCGSSNITYFSECPQCKGINFKQQDLIEHYSCGEVYPKEVNWETCPKCNKSIGRAGGDYVDFKDHYVCTSCNDQFPRPLFKFACFECNNTFIERLALWKKSKTYQTHK